MTKLPAFQFYPADWRKDPGVQALPFFERGVWFELLCLMHESDERGKLLLNGKPMPEDALARLLGLDKQILTSTITTLIEYGVTSRDDRGCLISRRMVRDENLRQIRAEAGKKGGNPVLLNQKPNQNATTPVKQNSTPSSSSSSSSTCKKQVSPISEVFEHWKQTLNHHKATLDDTRKKRIEKFLRLFTVDQLKSAVDGIASSAWHMGENPQGIRYDKISNVFRDADAIEGFIALAGKANQKTKLASVDYDELEAQIIAKMGVTDGR